MNTPKDCETCKGHGSLIGACMGGEAIIPCSECGGTGKGPTMKIKQLKNNHKRLIEAECKHCGTTVEAKEDSLNWEHDRDGDLAREKCPNPSCNAEIFFYRP